MNQYFVVGRCFYFPLKSDFILKWAMGCQVENYPEAWGWSNGINFVEQAWWANDLMRGTSPKFRRCSISICFKVGKFSEGPRCWKEAWWWGRTNHSKYDLCSRLGRAWFLMFGISLMYKRGLMDDSQSSVVKARNKTNYKIIPRVWKRPNVQCLEVGWCSKFTSRTKFKKRLMLRISMMGISSKFIN